MANSENFEELVVGLYDRGFGLPSNRILDIGTSKILKSKICLKEGMNLEIQ